jgi:tetratricopeptide (TPR) repeat protein
VLLGESLLAYAITVGAAESGPLYAEAFACAERSGDLGIQVALHNNAGCVALETGDIPGARAHLEAALRAAEALGDSHLVMSVNLGEVLRAEHDLLGARSAFEEVVRIARRTGDKHNLAGAIFGLACLAADLRDWHRAAMLHGIAQALTDQTGTPWEPSDERRRQESLDQARQALGGEQTQRAHTRGMTLRFDQAIDLALGKVPPAT